VKGEGGGGAGGGEVGGRWKGERRRRRGRWRGQTDRLSEEAVHSGIVPFHAVGAVRAQGEADPVGVSWSIYFEV
jgi:hypothetical protein